MDYLLITKLLFVKPQFVSDIRIFIDKSESQIVNSSQIFINIPFYGIIGKQDILIWNQIPIRSNPFV